MDNGIIFGEVIEKQRYLELSDGGQIGWTSIFKERPQEVVEGQGLVMYAHGNIVRYERN